MRAFRRPFGSMAGFSLIEVLAAITVFAVITLGVTPLLVSSLRGTNLSRSFTRSKNLVQEAMERVRGFPYFDTGTNRDVLDLYFPNLTAGTGGSGYNSTNKSFITLCTSTSSLPAATGPSACPSALGDGTSRIPAGHTLTFTGEFVVPSGSGPETFVVQTPPAGYTASDPGLAIPPAQLMRLTITMSWSQIGTPRQFTLTSLIGDRKLSPDKARANATVDYVAQAITSYKRLSASARLSRLTASAGRSTADIEIRNLASASVESKAGELSLLAEESASEPEELIRVAGAASPRVVAPPVNYSPLTPISDTDAFQFIAHPDLAFANIAFLANGSQVFPAEIPASYVVVTNNLPSALSRFILDSSNIPLWADNQADTSTTALRKLSPTDHVFAIHKLSGKRLTGSTQAYATSTSPVASRKVEAIASSSFGRLELLPTTFIVEPATTAKSVIVIDNFASTFQCTSTGSAAGAIATGSWSADFQYYSDTNNNSLQDGDYIPVNSDDTATANLVGSTTATWSDELAELKALNPTVYDTVGTASDVHLFEDNSSVPPTIGYLTDMFSSPVISSLKSDTVSRVSLSQAIRLVTAQTDPLNAETALIVSVGKSSCEAADRRG